jgi:Protein of unknown function (DUF3349)
MRNRTRTTPRPPAARPVAAPTPAKRGALPRLVSAVQSVLGWLRAGYPDDAPRTGHSPLLALNGPLALTPHQTEHVIAELDGGTDTSDIEVAITKATDRLPTKTQIHAIQQALRHRRPG